MQNHSFKTMHSAVNIISSIIYKFPYDRILCLSFICHVFFVARDNKKGGRVPKDGVRRENEKNTKISNGPREDRENIPPRGGKGGFNRRKENEGAPEGDSPAKDDKREAGSGMGFGGRGRGGRGGNVARGGRGGFDRGARGGRKRDYDRRSGSDRT